MEIGRHTSAPWPVLPPGWPPFTGGRGKFTFTFDKAGSGDARPCNQPGIDSDHQYVVLVPHIPDRGDTGGDVEQGIVLANMPVHFIHTRDQGAALTINDCFISSPQAVCRLNAGDAIAAHHHVPDCAEGQGFGLKILTLAMRIGPSCWWATWACMPTKRSVDRASASPRTFSIDS